MSKWHFLTVYLSEKNHCPKLRKSYGFVSTFFIQMRQPSCKYMSYRSNFIIEFPGDINFVFNDPSRTARVLWFFYYWRFKLPFHVNRSFEALPLNRFHLLKSCFVAVVDVSFVVIFKFFCLIGHLPSILEHSRLAHKLIDILCCCAFETLRADHWTL